MEARRADWPAEIPHRMPSSPDAFSYCRAQIGLYYPYLGNFEKLVGSSRGDGSRSSYPVVSDLEGIEKPSVLTIFRLLGCLLNAKSLIYGSIILVVPK